MKKQFYYGLMVALLLSAAAFIYGCGSAATSGGGGGGATISNRTGTYHYAGTQAPGDVWSWTISTSEFSGTNESNGSWVTGEWTTLASGFGKLTVIGSSTIDAIGKSAYFVEYPDTALIVIPVGESNNPIICAARATSHPTDKNYVSIAVPGDTWNKASSTAYGTANVTWETNTARFNVSEFQWDGSPKAPGADELTFEASTGMLTSTTGGLEKLFLTPSGMFIVDNGPGAGGHIGISVESFSSIEAANHSYRGINFRYFPNGAKVTSESNFVALESNPSIPGTLKGHMYSGNDPASGYDPAMEAIFSFVTQESTGIISTEAAQVGNPPSGVKSVFAKIGTGADQKYIWFGFNVNGSDLPETILFIQTD